MAMCCTAVRRIGATNAPRRFCVSLRAGPDVYASRRATLGALVVAPFVATSKAFGMVDIGIDNHRYAQKLALSLDEMRDSNANVRTRRNVFQGEGADLTLADLKSRTKGAAKRVADVASMLDKDRVEWSKLYQELHNATGTLRYDMSNLIASLPDKQAKKAANKLSKDAMEALEQLDLYTRKQDLTKARAWHGIALKKLQDAAGPLLA